jgi:hypothetical protein
MNDKPCKHVPANPRAFFTPCELCSQWVARNPNVGAYQTLSEISARGDSALTLELRARATSELVDVLMSHVHNAMSRALKDEDDVRIALLSLAARCHDSTVISLRAGMVRAR